MQHPFLPLALRSINSVRYLLSLVETEVGARGGQCTPLGPLALRSINSVRCLLSLAETQVGARGRQCAPMYPSTALSRQCSVLITHKKPSP
jgi:hypothetical protein